MSLVDIPYYRRRASEEKELAAGSENPDARRAHAELAKHYEALIENAGMLPPNRGTYDREQEDDFNGSSSQDRSNGEQDAR